MNKITLENKNILITGISGFVGTHLAEKLTKMGAHVYGISRTLSSKKIFKGDIQDFTFLDKSMEKAKIDISFHLAAESLVESGQLDPYKTFKSNILGTLNVLESGRKNNLEKIIVASTAHVYGDSPLPYKEIHAAKPSRPYETSKTSVDLIAQSYADTFNLPVLIPRFSNTYGPGDLNFNRLIPKTIKSILHNQQPKMWGGSAVRDYIYIDDVVSAYIKLAEMPDAAIEKNRIFNFGTGHRMSVKDVIELIADVSNMDVTIEKIEDARQMEIKKQYVSSAKAKRLLGWRPRASMRKGLEKTIAWYRNYFDKQERYE